MSTLRGRNRPKRSRPYYTDDDSDAAAAGAVATGGPLFGAIVCLSGFPPEDKERLHRLIGELGGEFTRDLNSTKNTHLVSFAASGPKYEAARSNPAIRIVSPSWLRACAERQTRVPESEHAVDAEERVPSFSSSASAPPPPKPLSLERAFGKQLEDTGGIGCNFLFSGCQLYLVGFDEGSDAHVKVGRLLRRGLGTIFWDFNESISHVIVNDDSEETIRDAANALRLQQPNCPVFVSPWWILSCWQNNRLVDHSDFPPRYRRPAKKANTDDNGTVKKSSRARSHPRGSSIFRGCLFALLRVSPPPDAVDFDSGDLERLIRNHGGQMITSKLVEALKVDGKQRGGGPEAKRKCYVVGWGCFTRSHLLIHPLLAQVKRHDLCDVLEVTPIWLRTCLKEQTDVSPDTLPVLFRPEIWPIRSLVAVDCVGDGAKRCGDGGPPRLRISVTGFSGPLRTAIVHLIEAMGACYDDSMRSSTTHLVCSGRRGSGPKFEKAIQWKLHVVTIDWLYHIARYGYSGENNHGSEGCECRFSVVSANAATDREL